MINLGLWLPTYGGWLRNVDETDPFLPVLVHLFLELTEHIFRYVYRLYLTTVLGKFNNQVAGSATYVNHLVTGSKFLNLLHIPIYSPLLVEIP